MLNISPYSRHFLRNLHLTEYAVIKGQFIQTISPAGPKVQCLDLANFTKVTPKLLLSLNRKLKKLNKHKTELNKKLNHSLNETIFVKEIMSKL